MQETHEVEETHMVDPTLLLDHLEMAERNVALGERHISQQRARLAAFRHDKELAGDAAVLLQRFEELQVRHVENRDRLLRALSQR